MPRRSFGGRPASRAVTQPAPMRNPPQQASPAPAPAPVQGESIFGAIGSMVAEGLAWGAGSSIGHRAVDAVMGPRTVHVDSTVHMDGTVHMDSAVRVDHADNVHFENVNTVLVSGPVGSHACNTQSKAFQDCINNYGRDIGKCQFYIDMLNECRRRSGAVVRA